MNTGFLILIANANLKYDYGPKFVTQYFDGPFTDYMPFWYRDVGYLLAQTMFI